MSEYNAVQKGSLKLKGVSDHGSKKKKKKDKQKEKLKDAVELEQQTSPTAVPVSSKTKAEMAFEKRKWKKFAAQLPDKASKSHKDRIMDFNRHLDSLTEHFDIPKVSWTK